MSERREERDDEREEEVLPRGTIRLY